MSCLSRVLGGGMTIMAFAVTSVHGAETNALPLYYTGLTGTARVREQGGAVRTYRLARDYSIAIDVEMGPQSLTWFVIGE